MHRTRFDDWPCSIARTVDLLGDYWTTMVVRASFMGARRFEQYQRQLDVSRKVLSERLTHLVENGVLEKRPYQERPLRHEYRLTSKGAALYDVIAAMMRWGDDWLAGPEGPPIVLVDRETGAEIRPVVVDERSGERLDPRRVRAQPGPGFPPTDQP